MFQTWESSIRLQLQKEPDVNPCIVALAATESNGSYLQTPLAVVDSRLLRMLGQRTLCSMLSVLIWIGTARDILSLGFVPQHTAATDGLHHYRNR